MNWPSKLFGSIFAKKPVIFIDRSWQFEKRVMAKPGMTEAQATCRLLLGHEIWLGVGSEYGKLTVFTARKRAEKLVDEEGRANEEGRAVALAAVNLIDRTLDTTPG